MHIQSGVLPPAPASPHTLLSTSTRPELVCSRRRRAGAGAAGLGGFVPLVSIHSCGWPVAAAMMDCTPVALYVLKYWTVSEGPLVAARRGGRGQGESAGWLGVGSIANDQTAHACRACCTACKCCLCQLTLHLVVDALEGGGHGQWRGAGCRVGREASTVASEGDAKLLLASACKLLKVETWWARLHPLRLWPDQACSQVHKTTHLAVVGWAGGAQRCKHRDKPYSAY